MNHDHHHDHTHEDGREMPVKEKLEILLSHWVDHNDSHKDNFYSWAKQARQAGLEETAVHLEQAGDLSEKVTRQLKLSRDNLNG